MPVVRNSLSLSPLWKTEDPIVLVSWLDSFRMCHEGGCEEVPAREAIDLFDEASHLDPTEIREFFAEANLTRLRLSDTDEHELVEAVREAIQDGTLVVLCQGNGMQKTPDATLEQRRLVKDIEREARGRLSYGGRQYKLVADRDFAKMPGRDDFEVASRDEARRALSAWANESVGRADLVALFGKASEKLTADWRPPESRPDGLILLRRVLVPLAAISRDESSITPSQMQAFIQSKKPCQFFARFVDEQGKSVTGFTGKIEHDSDPECDLPFTGLGFSSTSGLTGKKQAWLTVPGEAMQDLAMDLKKRWREFRGRADAAWKAKEENLVEVLFKDGQLPALELEAVRR